MGKIWVLRSLIELNSKQVTCREKKGCVLLFILGRLFCGRDQTVRATSGIDAFFVQDWLCNCLICVKSWLLLIVLRPHFGLLYSIELNFRYTDIISRHNEVLYQLNSSALRIFIILMLAFQLSWLYALMTNENIKLYTITELHVDTKDLFDHSWALLGSIVDLGAFGYTFSVTVVQL